MIPGRGGRLEKSYIHNVGFCPTRLRWGGCMPVGRQSLLPRVRVKPRGWPLAAASALAILGRTCQETNLTYVPRLSTLKVPYLRCSPSLLA